ncbi:hypothetical protein LMG31506_05856 [Cupriavidus yeoncheonensis]|uniref:GlsB/YeaQ/YmgE family stress response membrane protein n=1 Tax=Cupriavidus yeoncheonensis TaxID=1462994 RepID=A0A916IZZ1_9BURK|nr:hypothetical protein [Cupriavidus yeoncheonensis]CAG2156937.1 hypothetical protein LMG31506_05856 [Cupriavidus yeoncheonensis]
MLGTLIVGLLVGLAARQMHPAGKVVSLPAALVLGMAGAAAAFYGGRALHLFIDGQMSGWLAAIVGASVLVGLWGALRPRHG